MNVSFTDSAVANFISKQETASIVTVTKNIVDTLLAMNTRNRPIKKAHLQNITEEVLSNRFYLTSAGVGVSKTGVLLDGQNRLMAIRDAGYPPVRFVLVTGLEDESQVVMDRHSRRDIAGALSISMNQTVSTSMVSVARFLLEFGCLRGKRHEIYRMSNTLKDREIYDFVALHFDLLVDLVTLTRKKTNAAINAGFFVYMYHDRYRAENLINQFVKGEHLTEDMPAYRLRELIDSRKIGVNTQRRMYLYRATISASINHARGKRCKNLKTSSSWAEFPYEWMF